MMVHKAVRAYFHIKDSSHTDQSRIIAFKSLYEACQEAGFIQDNSVVIKDLEQGVAVLEEVQIRQLEKSREFIANLKPLQNGQTSQKVSHE